MGLFEKQMAIVGLLARMSDEFNRLISVNTSLFQLSMLVSDLQKLGAEYGDSLWETQSHHEYDFKITKA